MASDGDAIDIKIPTISSDIKQCKKCMVSKQTKGSEVEFLKALTVWIKKPHVVNRRLCGTKLISIQEYERESEVREYLENKCRTFSFLTNSLQHPFEDLSAQTTPYTVITRQLIPKSEFFPRVAEAIVHDRDSRRVYFIPFSDYNSKETEKEKCSTKEICYCIQFNSSGHESIKEMLLFWSCDHEETDISKRQVSSKWLTSVLLDKLVNWSAIDNISTSTTSLQLVDVDEYQKTYLRLKNQYGRDLVKNWTESTDPQKFVYEDIAIATYLLLIWQEDRQAKNLQEKQTFVDLGCGNGLLVYILTKEGHRGLGIDLRKRKIWDTFGPDIDLQERTVTPSGDHLFPDYDWIIGNHSDELTPWIPVISARSCYTSCFFVLPCCHFDFVGKFTASEKGMSKYGSYLNYVKDVVKTCGFLPERDTLRIPSTKRICYIGRYRTYNKEEEEQADTGRQDFITRRSKLVHNERGKSFKSKSTPSFSGLDKDNKLDVHLCASEHSTPTTKSTHNPSVNTLYNNCVPCQPEMSCQSSNNQSENASNNDSRHGSPLSKKFRIDAKLETGHSKPCSNEEGYELTRSVETSSKHKSDAALTVVKSVDSVTSSEWVSNFQPRVESRVRNCQQVPQEVKQKIVGDVFQLVLSASADNFVVLDNQTKWCKGGVVPLSEVVSLFDKSILQQLKSECGGLQTLLRNHSHIFQVTRGNVQLRDFTKTDPWEGRNPQKVKNKQRKTVKTTLCWFHSHHPDGCPRASASCLYAHGQDDLQEKSLISK